MRPLQCLLRPSTVHRHSLRPGCVYIRRTLVTLAIETSCDDTAVAILDHTPRRTALLFNERISSDSRAFQGIHPSVTVEGHATSLAGLVRRSLASLPDAPAVGHGPGRICWTGDGVKKVAPDFLSVTRGPGMSQNLSIGLSTAKGLAVAWGVPLVGVHHMQAHALTPRLVSALARNVPEEAPTKTSANQPADTNLADGAVTPEFPFLTLLVSGGHTQLVHSTDLTTHRIIATTCDSAIGNILDQTARVILPPEVLTTSEDVMYGRLLETFAFPPSDADPYAFYKPAASRREEILDTQTGYPWTIPQSFRQTRRLVYSFASIHSTVHRIATERPDMDIAERLALAKYTMAAAFDHLAGRLCLALEDKPELQAPRTLVVSGGVACNKFLMHVLRSTLDARGLGGRSIVAPPVELCTDNAAMVAWAGMEMYEAGFHTDLSVRVVPKWPMDPEHGEGIMGASGWLRRDGYE